MDLQRNIILIVIKPCYIRFGANIFFHNYDAIRKPIAMKRNISNVVQREFVNSLFGLTKAVDLALFLCTGVRGGGGGGSS